MSASLRSSRLCRADVIQPSGSKAFPWLTPLVEVQLELGLSCSCDGHNAIELPRRSEAYLWSGYSMSDEPKQRSHTIRLTVSMVLGVLAGAVLVPLIGGRAQSFTPLICTASGALTGLGVEMRRRFLEVPLYIGREGTSDEACSGNARETKSATLNRWAGWGMLVGAVSGFNAALLLGQPPGAKQLLALSLLSLDGTAVGGVLGLLLGLGRTLFLTYGKMTKSGQAN